MLIMTYYCIKMKKQRRHGCRSAIWLVRGQRQDVFRSTMAKIYYNTENKAHRRLRCALGVGKGVFSA